MVTHLQIKPVWTTGLYFGHQKKVLKTIFYKKPRITSPKTTYKAVCVQWHPRNYPQALHRPDGYKDRQEKASAFLLAAVFPGQYHAPQFFIMRLNKLHLGGSAHYGLEGKDTYPFDTTSFYFRTEDFKGPD